MSFRPLVLVPDDAGGWFTMSWGSAVRVGLCLLAAIDGLVGTWSLLWPSAFYQYFPGLGMHWVAAEGPYSQHVLTDFGGALLAIAVALALSAIIAQRQLIQVVLIAALIQSAQHLIFHLTHYAALPTRELVLERVTLAAPVLLAVVLLAYARCSTSTASTTDLGAGGSLGSPSADRS